MSFSICVPVENVDGRRSKVCDRFGSAPYLLIYRTEDDSLTFVDNGDKDHPRGMCQPLRELADHAVTAVVSRGMGAHGIEMLTKAGVQVYRAEAETAGEAIEGFRMGNLEQLGARGAYPRTVTPK